MKKLLFISMALVVAWSLTETVGATVHRAWSVGGIAPDGLCEGVRFKGTTNEITYEDYFEQEWSAPHRHSDVIKRNIAVQMKGIERAKKAFCN